MTTLLIVILLILIGILLLFIEFTIIPGTTVAGVVAVGLFVYAVFLCYADYGIGAAIATAAFILIVAPVLVVKFFKTKAGKKMQLETKLDGHVDGIHDIKVGDEGITEGRLAPVGKVRIGQQSIEAKSISGFIDENTAVKVIEVNRTQLVVDYLGTLHTNTTADTQNKPSA